MCQLKVENEARLQSPSEEEVRRLKKKVEEQREQVEKVEREVRSQKEKCEKLGARVEAALESRGEGGSELEQLKKQVKEYKRQGEEKFSEQAQLLQAMEQRFGPFKYEFHQSRQEQVALLRHEEAKECTSLARIEDIVPSENSGLETEVRN